MKPSKTSLSKSKKQNLRCSFTKAPRHLFAIPALSFQKDIENWTINESWFKLGEWTHGYDTDKNGLQMTVMRLCLLIPLGKFETVFDSLESVGNLLSEFDESQAESH